ncbi:hypothetical protein D3C81_2144490 [compost metagenome]
MAGPVLLTLTFPLLWLMTVLELLSGFRSLVATVAVFLMLSALAAALTANW